jgi:hypothetical protein
MTKPSLADLPINSIIGLIGSNLVSPGAGAAGAIALALASACATKAVSISLKHSPHEPRLTVALPHLKNLCGWALHGADVDSAAFKEFIREKSPQAATELLRAGETIAHLIEGLFRIITDIEPHITPSMAGDLLAASALATASRSIQSANEAQTKGE